MSRVARTLGDRRADGVVVAICLVLLAPVLVGLYVVDRNRAHDLAAEQAARAAAIERAALVASWQRYDTALASCLRGNDLRRATTELQTATQALAFLLSAFFDSSAEFRLRQGNPRLAEESIAARDRIVQIAKEIRTLEPVDCAAAVPEPSVPRPGGSGE